MRKTLSIILTAAMLLSVLAAIPFGAGAESAAAAMYAKTTFETEAEQYFHNNNRSAATVEKADDTQGYAAKLTSFISATRSNASWPSNIRISETTADGTVSAFNVKAGATYDLSFMLKVDSLPTNVSITEFYVCYAAAYNGRFLFSNNPYFNSWGKTAISLNSYITASNSTWARYKFNFTVPDNIGYATQLVLLPVTSTDCSGVVWIDDIIIGESNLNKTFADFENIDEFFNVSTNFENY